MKEPSPKIKYILTKAMILKGLPTTHLGMPPPNKCDTCVRIWHMYVREPFLLKKYFCFLVLNSGSIISVLLKGNARFFIFRQFTKGKLGVFIYRLSSFYFIPL